MVEPREWRASVLHPAFMRALSHCHTLREFRVVLPVDNPDMGVSFCRELLPSLPPQLEGLEIVLFWHRAKMEQYLECPWHVLAQLGSLREVILSLAPDHLHSVQAWVPVQDVVCSATHARVTLQIRPHGPFTLEVSWRGCT